MLAKGKRGKLFILLFLLPAVLIYVFFQIVPLFGAIYFSLSDWNGLAGTPITFVGLSNYTALFKDSYFLLSLKNLLVLVVGSVLFHTPFALLLAVALTYTKRGFRVLKAIYFVPTVFPLTAVGLMWYFIFMPNGSFNALLEAMGFSGRAWLVESSTAMNTITFVNIWAGIGYYMVIVLAGLTTVPTDIYEAADIDGANVVTKFFRITVPMLRSTLTMCVLLDIMGTIKIFDLVFAMTEGGPNGMTNLPTTLMYQEAFRYDHYGTGSAIGVVILLICLVMTVVTQTFSKASPED